MTTYLLGDNWKRRANQEVYPRLVGLPVFKTSETPTRSLAGSIPVRLLQLSGRRRLFDHAVLPEFGHPQHHTCEETPDEKG